MLPLLGGHAVLIVAADVLGGGNEEARRAASGVYRSSVFDTKPICDFHGRRA